jgi:hypothetical protein
MPCVWQHAALGLLERGGAWTGGARGRLDWWSAGALGLVERSATGQHRQ